ncbi:MAG: DNA translocase FtsK [Ignavibacteria bacterium]|nr:DNA translocase FtsK [Ignavibacteria bacterium]
MASEKDKVEIQYRRKRKSSFQEPQTQNDSAEELRKQIEEKYFNRLKIISILVLIFSFFAVLSILSYSPKDEFIYSFSFKDVLGLITGDESAIQKAKSVSNLLGPFGAVVANFFIKATIGYFSVIFPILAILWSLKIILTKSFSGPLAKRTLFAVIGLVAVASFLESLNLLFALKIPYFWIGSLGYSISNVLSNIFGNLGALLIPIFTIFFAIIFTIEVKIENFFLACNDGLKKILGKLRELRVKRQNENIEKETQAKGNLSESIPALDEDIETGRILIQNISKNENGSEFIDKPDSTNSIIRKDFSSENLEKENYIAPLVERENRSDDIEQDLESNENDRKLVVIVEQEEEDVVDGKKSAFSPLSTITLDEKINYTPPPIDLLIDDESKFQINEEELKQNARTLQEKLETFKIYIENLTVTPGPVVTLFEFVPAPGIKISRIQSLADDIALGLKAKGIRIIAPVPGKGTVGIEMPNRKPLVVRFGNCLKNARIPPNFKLPIILGKTISGEVYVDDLTKMPHLLIAGATGSGKSVGINTIIVSLIYKMSPQNLKFVIIDPKKVELSQYQQLLYHYLAVSTEIEDAIITEPHDAVHILKSLVAEMQIRYDILASVNQKNIAEYNKKVKDGVFKNETEFEHRPLPYIIVVIDELADLMLTAGKEIETLIIRLAQLARAVGIHLVVATQRPSVDIITGLIKANFPARIAYLVASRVDSRTIIDTIGAEQLLGSGDMLFLPNGSPTPIRLQNAFLTTEEIERICDYIGNQKGFSKPYYLPAIDDGKGAKELVREGFDPLFAEAARLIVRYQQASVSMLQRRLKVGYNRAGRIMDELEIAGIVGPFDGSKGRTIKIKTEEELNDMLSKFE